MQNALGTVGSVLLLGGRSEIGLAIVRRLVTAGARHIVLAARGGEPDQDTVAAIEAAGAASVRTVPFDVTAPGTHRSLIADVATGLGDLDVVIDAVGVLGSSEMYERDPVAAADAVVANFGGHVSVGLAVAEVLRAQGHGTFIVLSSVAGVRVRKANYIYGATKAGLDGFAQGLGDALAGSGASVMVVRPGFVRTQMTTGMPDAPFTIDADGVAAAVVDGLRNHRETVWAPAIMRPVFGVLRLLPRPLWRRLPR